MIKKPDKNLKDNLGKPNVMEVGTKGTYNGYRYLINDIQYDERIVLQSNYSSSERSKLIEKSEEHGIIVLPEGSVKEEAFLNFINSQYCKHKATGFFLKSGAHYNGNNAFTENSLSVEVIGLNNSELKNLCEKIIRELSVDTVILKTEPSNSLFFIERQDYLSAIYPKVAKAQGVIMENKLNIQNNSINTEISENSKYTFDNFVVGPSNKFAYAATKAIASNPISKQETDVANYNPLVIYGATSLGKTHLLKAIKNEMSEKYPGLAVILINAEEFANEYITALMN